MHRLTSHLADTEPVRSASRGAGNYVIAALTLRAACENAVGTEVFHSVWKWRVRNLQYFKANVNRGGATTKTFGTTNLIRHLKHHHPAEHSQFEEAKKGKA